VELPTCDECGERPANVFLTKVEGSHLTKSKFCETCAKLKQLGGPFGGELSLDKVVANLLEAVPLEGPEQPAVPAGVAAACPGCGLEYQGFVKHGRFGCAGCYEAFATALPSVFKEVQRGYTEHRGRVPLAARERLDRQRKAVNLRVQLAEAVKAEQYELAAKLRDEIGELTSETELTAHAQC
ncbi:MAG: hypothetical protein GW802_20465, partial [Armatimonadetes bacterium]|nr:hypothetical protein [Armatimonadota bacterium]